MCDCHCPTYLDGLRRLIGQRRGRELHRGVAHEGLELLVALHRELLLQQRQLLLEWVDGWMDVRELVNACWMGWYVCL